MILSGTLIKDYEVLGMLGSGSFSSVYRCLHVPTTKEVALKVVLKATLKDAQCRWQFDNEMRTIKNVDHPFIVEMFEVFEDEKNFYVSMEYAKNGSCLTYVNKHGPFREDVARRIFAEALSALDYLHNNLMILHRDIKAENILLDQDLHVRLIDFGFSNEINNNNPLAFKTCGSPAYAAPEMLKGQTYTQSCDIWSLGIFLYAIVVGELPFSDDNIQRLLQKIIYTEPKYGNCASIQMRDIIIKLLRKDPKIRITIPDIYNHPWITVDHRNLVKINRDFGVDLKMRRLPIDTEIESNEENLRDDESMVKYRIYRRCKVSKMISDYFIQEENRQKQQICEEESEYSPKTSKHGPFAAGNNVPRPQRLNNDPIPRSVGRVGQRCGGLGGSQPIAGKGGIASTQTLVRRQSMRVNSLNNSSGVGVAGREGVEEGAETKKEEENCANDAQLKFSNNNSVTNPYATRSRHRSGSFVDILKK